MDFKSYYSMCFNPFLTLFLFMFKLLQIWLRALSHWLLYPFGTSGSSFELFLFSWHNQMFWACPVLSSLSLGTSHSSKKFVYF